MDFIMQELCPEIGSENQKKLLEKTVTVIGIGGVGSTVVQILARNGINLRLIDKGRILEKDMPRQTLYRIDDITKFKAKQTKKILEEINNEAKIRTFHEDLTKDNVFLAEADIIVDLSNDFKTSEFVNKFAVEKKIPLIFANYAGTKGHVLIVDKLQNKGPCLNCVKDKLQFKPLTEVGIYSPITTILASLVASAVIKNLLDIDNVDKLMTIDVMKTEIRHETVEKNKNCEICKGK